MRHLVLDVISIGLIGAVCAPVGCSSTTEPGGRASVTAGDDGAPVGEAQEEVQSCSHSTCTTGAKLGASCSTCASTVCSFGAAYCCGLVWDDHCVQLAAGFCAPTQPPRCGCAHDVCTATTTGPGLDSGCSACTTRVCDSMPSCCGPGGNWDGSCVMAAEMFCGANCAPACEHSPCKTGAALEPSCSPCVETLCSATSFGSDPFCCGADGGHWDERCVDAVAACEGCGF